jgi:HD-GYP domain-containing protein (c-di-GMP phosphodiesterase class II)
MHRNSLQGLLSQEVGKVVEWACAGPADVVVDCPGEGRLAHCPCWPGPVAAAALVQAGFERLRDRRNMERLHAIGRALGSEQNLDRLLDLVLTHGRDLLQAEAGSIYLVLDTAAGRELLFAHTQNARFDRAYQRFRVPVSADSAAGFAALTGATLNLPDVYAIPPEAPYRFNASFDQQTGYRSTSMLVVPLLDTEGRVLGVLQFINRLEAPGGPSVPFRTEHERLAQSLAGQAGVAVKNARLREEIESLFEHFVHASVLAIEQRDPVTSGHSARVAQLTVGLAEAVNRTGQGAYAATVFTGPQLRELRYASLLHDFGKVGVREDVLVKAKKLPASRLEILLQRLRQRREERLLESLRRDWESGQPFDPGLWAGRIRAQDEETECLMAALIRSNEPSVLPQDLADGLEAMGVLTCCRWDGTAAGILEPADLASLGIRKGSLSEAERREIESHVTHTFRFLSQIPWTRDLASVPSIAFAHHERPNGQGYPRGLAGAEIPVQSRVMAIADVFDALTAQDRPYKAAVPLERSLDMLHADAREGNVDPDLLAIFVEARIYELTIEA